MIKILLLCGGCSPERSISLNSARSVFENIEDEFDTKIIFFSKELKKYIINSNFLYSNTVSDFDFKLCNECTELSDKEFLKELHNYDLVFPVMHGVFAENGQIQEILEREKIAFVGSGSKQCAHMYNKENAEKSIIQKHKFKSVAKLFLKPGEKNITKKISDFFFQEKLTEAIIKPIEGGSSFGVRHAKNLDDALKISELMIAKENKDILIEKRCLGKEFTVIILQNLDGKPVSLIPIEIEIKNFDNIIFDTRRKYLATNETHYHCPPRFNNDQIEKIRKLASELFKISQACDFLRIDGWLLANDEIYFSDFNPISGMEQNSFIFQQSSKIGFTHQEAVRYIINSAAKRAGLEITNISDQTNSEKKKVNVIFGGITSERQVSLLSGSNVWQKLLKSKEYFPRPFLLFMENNSYQVILLPYSMVLYHTVEEILYQFKNNNYDYVNLANKIRIELGLEKIEIERPILMTFDEFLEKSKSEDTFVFIALHGGFGENGEIQHRLKDNNLSFNGSDASASKLCMNKYETSKIVNSLNLSGVRSAKNKMLNASILKKSDSENLKKVWEDLTTELNSIIVVKPNCDGCSTGVIILENSQEFIVYIKILKSGVSVIPENSFSNQKEKVAINPKVEELLFEEFIKTDKIEVSHNNINFFKKTGWVELTVGVLESKNGYHALKPSITVAQSNKILSVEEKFQGGIGINITPPPQNLISLNLLEKIQRSVEIVSAKIGIKDYCRIDLFANSITNEIIIIEFNTLPALTPSTVLFQQSSKEVPPITVLKLLRNIIMQNIKACPRYVK
ncbi:MAG: hypothetical protein LBJ32_00610 [Oscillospiraceae bacterium]|nr:hypothetical protein [Oscillospiraceae bacterium]